MTDDAPAMLVLDQIEARLARLRGKLKGKRVGIAPADFGRFSRGMSELLRGLDVRAIFLDDPRAHDQGYTPVTDAAAFLESVDACLLFGLDPGAAKLLHAAHATGKATRFIALLDRSDPDNLLWEPQGYTFRDAYRLEADDPALAALGIRLDCLQRNYRRTETSEKALRRGAAQRPGTARGPWRPFVGSILRTGRAYAVCPACGATLTSAESYPVTAPGLGCMIFHRFHCHFEFHLMAGIYGEGLCGVYIPQTELVLRIHLGYDPSLAHNFREEQYTPFLDTLKRCCLYMPGLVRRYQAQTAPRSILGLTGVIHQFGEQLNWELTALDRLAGSRSLRQALDQVLVTRYDPYGIAALFPELGVRSALAPSEERVSTETFRQSLEANALCVLPADVGPVSERLARRITAVARGRCSFAFARRMSAFRRRNALVVWITLRSQRRVWRSQVEGLAAVLGALAQKYQGLGVIVDGAPVWEGAALAQLRASLPGVDLLDGLRFQMHESIAAARLADFFIAPLGNGTNFTSLANIPGILHGPRAFLSLPPDAAEPFPSVPNPRQNAVPALCLPPCWDANDADRLHSGSYDLDAQKVLELALELAEGACKAKRLGRR